MILVVDYLGTVQLHQNGGMELKNENLYLKIRRNQLGLTQQEVADQAEIQLKEYQRIEMGIRDIRRVRFQIGYNVLRALQIDVDKYMNGEYLVKEVLYRGADGRLYNFETAEPVEAISTPQQ